MEVTVGALSRGDAAIRLESVPSLAQGGGIVVLGRMSLAGEEVGPGSMPFYWFCAKYLSGRDQQLALSVEVSYANLAGERWTMEHVLIVEPTGEVGNIRTTGISRA